ncbi:MAG: tRNA guanosine(34) transglycosylase Tgt [Candidatus Rokubacteria bacterium]|nr:tRNA guanosine(34) transglycosylase Tgt [Candidatus Rokubacteria bacterium]
MRFELLKADGLARAGRLSTPHGVVETPAFMPVGTQGSVKSLAPEDLRQIGTQILLANTYHLFLRPGHLLVAELGGLHRFMAWEGPILTDSGGFQVYSLASLGRVTEEGVRFRSHLDGAEHLLTPELSVEIQQALGADIIHPLDECLAHPAPRAQTEASLALTLRWAARAKAAWRRGDGRQAMFGIVQGGGYEDVRRRAVEEACALEFDGYAVGGLAVGEPKPLMLDLLEFTAALLPKDRPRYLMGVGTPPDLLGAVARGVDLFDCVLPTRNARNGQLFTAAGVLTIKQARYATDQRPADEGCPCYTCRTFSRAYLRHLFAARELLAYRLLSLHNLHFYLALMAETRAAIRAGAFETFRARFLARYAVSSGGGPSATFESTEV